MEIAFAARLLQAKRHGWPVANRSLLVIVHLLLVCLIGASPGYAGFPAPATNLTRIRSPLDPSITISYKEPTGACATLFDTQQQYTGWVSVPGSYPTNIFFWFVAARDPTSMLSIYLNGGPGSSSMFGLFAEAGPCEVIETGNNQLSTAAREWGWDRASNMLFIDQPNQVGFSYDILTNGTVFLANDTITVPPVNIDEVGTEPGDGFIIRNGTFASQNSNHTANTTAIAAKAIYHMMQGFLATFPQYNPPNNSSLGVNLFAESYGGHYGPAFAYQWEQENLRPQNGTYRNSSTVEIHLASLGLINGCVDDLVAGPYYVAMMMNNSYGLQLLPTLQASLVNASFYASGGCRELLLQCRSTIASMDPNDTGANQTVNDVCSNAVLKCDQAIIQPYGDSGRNVYDIGHKLPDSFPKPYYIDYLNSAPVQSAIGASLNYTDTSNTVYAAFASTGDHLRGSLIEKLAALIKAGVRVGMMYGDRDFICNWMGGEAVSLAIAEHVGAPYSMSFPSAGYAPIIVNDSYIGGVVRQFGNLSFSRIYQAGHFVPAYQPETAFQVFARIILGTDVGTGEPVDLSVYNTTGPSNATSTFSPPDSPSPTCFLWSLSKACSGDAISSLRAGEGTVINGAWYRESRDWPGVPSTTSHPASSGESVVVTATSGASRVTVTSSTSMATGVFTATVTPGAANSIPQAPSVMSIVGVVLASWAFFCVGTRL